MRRNGRKITLGLIVIVLGAGVLLKVIPPETDVALNDRHLVSIDGTLVSNPLDLSESTGKPLAFPLNPVHLALGTNAEQNSIENNWVPGATEQPPTSFLPPLAGRTSNSSGKASPTGTQNTPPQGGQTSGDIPDTTSKPQDSALPPVLSNNGGNPDKSGGSDGGGSGGNGSGGNGGNSGGGSGPGPGPTSPPENPDPSKDPLPPLPVIPPGSVVPPSPDYVVPPGVTDPLPDGPTSPNPEIPSHSVPETGGTLGSLGVAILILIATARRRVRAAN